MLQGNSFQLISPILRNLENIRDKKCITEMIILNEFYIIDFWLLKSVDVKTLTSL